MIEDKPPEALTLFDLIGRSWDLGQPVAALAFNANTSTLACALSDGRVALLPVVDAEHPEKRIRMELETGRTTIRPREKALPPPVHTETSVDPNAPAICCLGEQGFAIADPDGAIWRVTARGQVLRLAIADGPVTALCPLPRSGAIAIARGADLRVMSDEMTMPLGAARLPGEIHCLAVSPDEAMLITWGGGRFTLLERATLEVKAVLDCTGDVLDIACSPDGRWIVAGCADKSLALIDLTTMLLDRIVDFPSEVRSAGFSAKGAALLASGA